MSRFIFLFVIFLSFFSCHNETKMEIVLKNGLKKYERKRPVHERLNDDFAVQEIAIYKKDSITYILIFKLNDDANEALAKKYSMAIHAFVQKEFLIKRNDYMLLDYKPEVEIFNSNKYFIKEFQTKAKRIDSLDIFLFDRDKYRQVLGRKVTVRNIGL